MYPRPYAHYTLLERIAVGGMSEVDLACRTVDDSGYVRFLAVKRIRAEKNADESFIRMFQDEARITSALRHTHIAQVYDFGKVDNEYYLALEFVPGLNLRDMINFEAERGRVIPPKVAFRILIDVLDALQYAHSRCDDFGEPMSIVHRDANPRNIMVSTTGETKLIDFGVARATDRLERTRTNHFKGKVAYMAPEQVQGKEIDHRADIFAMGLTLFELVCGRGPFRGLDQMQIMYRLVQDRMPKIEPVGPYRPLARQLDIIFKDATKNDVNERYAHSTNMKNALVTLATGDFSPADASEMMAYLNSLDPNLKRRMQDKIKSYSETGSFPKSEIRPTPPSDDVSATLDYAEVHKNTGTNTAPLLLAGALGTATLTLLAVGGLLVIAIIAAVVLSSLPENENTQISDDRGSVQPVPTTEPILSEELEKTVDSQTKPAATPSTTPEPKTITLPERRRRSTSSPKDTQSKPVRTAPEETISTPVNTNTSPDVIPESAPLPAVTDTPKSKAPVATIPVDTPKTAPIAAVTGTLQITSNPKGRLIWLDGVSTSKSTPARIDWPIGAVTVRIEGFEQTQMIQLGENERRIVSFR